MLLQGPNSSFLAGEDFSSQGRLCLGFFKDLWEVYSLSGFTGGECRDGKTHQLFCRMKNSVVCKNNCSFFLRYRVAVICRNRITQTFENLHVCGLRTIVWFYFFGFFHNLTPWKWIFEIAGYVVFWGKYSKNRATLVLNLIFTYISG